MNSPLFQKVTTQLTSSLEELDFPKAFYGKFNALIDIPIPCRRESTKGAVAYK